MKILVHDFSGHPFQAQLSRELSRRGHDVTHSYCAAYTGGKGRLLAEPGERIVFEPVSEGRSIAKTSFVRRFFQELLIGWDQARQALRVRPDVLLLSTTPVPSMVVLASVLALRGIPWVLWHQDVQAIAMRRFAGSKLPWWFRLAAQVIAAMERWGARRAAAIVVIADGFLRVHERWGTAGKTRVIENWAPIDEITPVPRANAWAREHGLAEEKVLLYSGTLGLKHNPTLLVSVTRAVIDEGVPVRLVVVNEGPAVEPLLAAATELDVPLTLLPFQPYERLPEVLGAGDVLVVLLEKDAGVFSVPSKTLSYLCAGRPILGLMPGDNAAALLVDQALGCVLPPVEESVGQAAKWVASILTDPDEATRIGQAGRELAEQKFSLDSIADRFEVILDGAHDRK